MAHTNKQQLAAVDRFLRTGEVTVETPSSLAEKIDRHMQTEMQRSLSTALSTARQLVALTASHNGVLRISAYKGLAQSAHFSSEYDEARRAYLQVRKLVRQNPEARARVDRALIDVYMYLGDFAESRKRARSALRVFKQLALEAEVAKTEVNYANLLHRQDRHKDAEKAYARAGEFFEECGDRLPAARCHYNRANTLVQLFRFAEAQDFYRRAELIYRDEGHTRDATDSRWGLAWLHMLQGKFHTALKELFECEEAYRQIGVPLRVASCELDRAEVFLNLNLFEDARKAAIKAERMFKQLGVRYEHHKASFFRSKAAYALGLKREGKSCLARAQVGFQTEDNRGFLGATHLVAAIVAKDDSGSKEHLREARKLFSKAQLPLWQAITDLHSLSMTDSSAKAIERLRKNTAAMEVPHIYAGLQVGLGDQCATRGRMDQAIKHWEKAADRLDSIRAQLPPLGLRDKFGTEGDSPHRRLINAELSSNPTEAAVWSERFKTAGMWRPLSEKSQTSSVRNKAERSLAELAEQVASLSNQLGGTGERSALAVHGSANSRSLKTIIRDEMLKLEDDSLLPVWTSERISQELAVISQKLPIVQFHADDRDLVAFIHEKGQTRTHCYAQGREQLKKFAAQWLFLLESVALLNGETDTELLRQENKFLTRLGAWLWSPLEISKKTGELLVIPEGELSNLPWAALRDGNSPLGVDHRFVLSPSLRHYVTAKRTRVRSKRVQVFTGRTDDLPEAIKETDMLVALAGRDRVDLFANCQRSEWPGEGSASVWHFTGHTTLNDTNPFYSSLELIDGPLFAADFRLKNFKVGVATLASCRSGTDVSLPGEESTGLVRSLLEMGARNVVAGHWQVLDKSTVEWMAEFYKSHFSDISPTVAAQRASGIVREKYPSAFYWAPFAVFGAGS